METAWSGRMAYARHLMPQIGLLAPDVWYCTAFGGHGMNTASIGGRVVAEGITGDSHRYQLFQPFGLAWNGGALGRAAVQLTYCLIKRATGGGSAGRADRVYRCKATNRACWHNGCEPAPGAGLDAEAGGGGHRRVRVRSVQDRERPAVAHL